MREGGEAMSETRYEAVRAYVDGELVYEYPEKAP
jgi:hypothetical protein